MTGQGWKGRRKRWGMGDVHGNGEAPRAWEVGIYAGACKCRSFGEIKDVLGWVFLGEKCPEPTATNSGEMR